MLTTDALIHPLLPHFVSRFLLLTTILLGMVLRIMLITAFPFREDEAVYAMWALHSLTEDPLFLTIWPDKPPIFIWLLSAIFGLTGLGELGAGGFSASGFSTSGFSAAEFSARWLNMAASVLTIPVVAVTARRLWGRQAMLWTAIVLALNPFAIVFAPTGYTDPVLVFCGAVALYFAVSGRGFWAGIWLALAIMTKQQGLLYLPLICAFLACAPEASPKKAAGLPTHNGVRAWLAFLGGVALVVAPILYWDSLRWAVAPSPWDLSIRNYGALTLLPASAWWQRALAWVELLGYFVGSRIGWIGVIAICIIFLTQSRKGAKGDKQVLIAITFLCVWGIGFMLLHIITSVQIWDRYLLPLMPIFALLLGGLLSQIAIKGRSWASSAVGLGLGALLISASWPAAQGHIPIGGDHGDLAGLHEALEWMRHEQGDEPFIIYHQALGPQLRFYLFAEVRSGRVDLRWYPHATYLVDNAVKAPHLRKFLLQPDWASVTRLDSHGVARQVEAEPIESFGRFQLVELFFDAPDCAWCVCREYRPSVPFRLFEEPLTPIRKIPNCAER